MGTRRYTKKSRAASDGQYRPKQEGKIPRKPKQTGAPKRPLTAYFLFMNDKRESYKSANPDAGFGGVAKLAAADWKKLKNKEKKKYEDEAKQNKMEYKEERKKYEASYKYKKYKRDLKEWNELYKEEWEEQEEEKEMKRKERKEKNKNKPKKTSNKRKAGKKKK